MPPRWWPFVNSLTNQLPTCNHRSGTADYRRTLTWTSYATPSVSSKDQPRGIPGPSPTVC